MRQWLSNNAFGLLFAGIIVGSIAGFMVRDHTHQVEKYTILLYGQEQVIVVDPVDREIRASIPPLRSLTIFEKHGTIYRMFTLPASRLGAPIPITKEADRDEVKLYWTYMSAE